MQKKWLVKAQLTQNSPDRIRDVMDILLKNRGLSTKTDQDTFFNDSNPHDLTPKELGIDTKQLKKAIERLKKAKLNDEKIVIYGDYDSDGVTSTAIMWETLNFLGFEVLPFLPHREKHGYGIKPSALADAISEYGKPKLIITVDNGIVAFEGAQYCKDEGIDLIICDHHEPLPSSNKYPENKKGKLTRSSEFTCPECTACVHTTKTAGAGVAYMFAKEILHSFKPSVGIEDLRPLLDQLVELATIGIVADLVPLLGPSRQIVKRGLQLLPQTKRPGLRALMADAGIDTNQPLSTYHIGFVLAPRINASGRLEHSIDSLRLLCTRNQERAVSMAFHLSQTNKERQELTNNNLSSIIESVKQLEPMPKIIVTASKDYNPGVIGLIAGKLTEYFARPSIAISIMDGTAKGSVRSVSDINIIEILRLFEAEFIELGGHTMAAGFSVATDNIDKLTKKLQHWALKNIDEEKLVPMLEIETELVTADISLKLQTEIERLAPFGMGNPKPVFATRGFTIASLMQMGKQRQHLRLALKDGNTVLEGILFSADEFAKKLKLGDMIDAAYQVDLNEWNGRRKIQLIVRDIKLL